MRALIQRVAHASVSVEGEVVGKIGSGLLIFLAIHPSDTSQELLWMTEKIANLRLFRDAHEKMNLSLIDTKGAALVVSQFTLYSDCTRGRRPDFLQSAPPDIAEPLYNQFIAQMRTYIDRVESGSFGKNMQVELLNDGPVTFLIEKNK
jgi:D-aminoacyl-tRNA deacylase